MELHRESCNQWPRKGIFWAKVPKAIVSAISQLFQGEKMGFEQVFDHLTVKHMDALRKLSQSLVDYVLSHCFWTYAELSKF